MDLTHRKALVKESIVVVEVEEGGGFDVVS